MPPANSNPGVTSKREAPARAGASFLPPGPFQAPGGGELRLRRGLARGNPLARRSQSAPLWEVPAPAALRGLWGLRHVRMANRRADGSGGRTGAVQGQICAGFHLEQPERTGRFRNFML